MDEGKKKTIPKKETKTWVKNESIINKHPGLKQARDIAQGIEKPAHKYTGGAANSYSGAGDPKYAEGWDRIFGKKNKDESEQKDN